MKTLDIARYAFSSSVAALLLAGCGGSQPPIGAPGLVAQGSLNAMHADRDGSWMLPEAKREDLLYISNPHPPNSKVFIFSYPRGKFVGVLKFPNGLPNEECSDKNGNVFIMNGIVVEYAHGGTKPINTLKTAYGAVDCSSDPKSGNLAVAYSEGSTEGWVAVYPNAQGMPTIYQTPNMIPYRCGYDDKGNLFIDGAPPYGSSFEFAELPNNGNAVKQITLDQSFQWPGPVQWDGKYITVGDSEANPEIIHRFAVSGSQVTSVGETSLSGVSPFVADWWIKGNVVVGAYGIFESPAVYDWDYPAGGSSTKTLTENLVTVLGVTVSIAPKH